MLNLIIFISGAGSNLKNIINAIKNKILDAKIVLVFSDDSTATGLKIASDDNIKTICIEHIAFKDVSLNFNSKARIDYDKLIYEQIKDYKFDYLVLAGFMHIFTNEFLNLVGSNKVINIHPSLLPSFKGAHGLKDAIDYGVKIIGATVHYVTKDLDAGHIISQAAAAISDNIESATEAIERRCEYYLYTYALNKLSKKKHNNIIDKMREDAWREKILLS